MRRVGRCSLRFGGINHPTLFWVPGTARARARTLSPRARGRRVAHQLMRPVEPADADVHDPRDARGSVDVERLLERHPLLLAASAVRGVDGSDRRARPERAPARAPREVRAREPAHGRRQARARDRHRVSSAENTTRGPRAACLCASRARDGGGAFGEGVSVPRVAPLAGFSPAESDRGGSGFARPSQRARLTEPRARSIRSRFGRGRLFVHTNFGARAVPRLETRGRNFHRVGSVSALSIAGLAFAGSIRRFVIRETDDRSEPRTPEPRSARLRKRVGAFGVGSGVVTRRNAPLKPTRRFDKTRTADETFPRRIRRRGEHCDRRAPPPTMSSNVTRTPALACDRTQLATGIVHFGVGGFHRSHQQVRVAPPVPPSFLFGLRRYRETVDASRRSRRRRRARAREPTS